MFHRPTSLTRAQSPVAISASILSALLTFAVLVALAHCAGVKPPLRAADEALKLACMGLAQAAAKKTGADAEKIIATTCNVENFTRTAREMLLSQQLDAARAQGVLVPDINSGALEDDAPEEIPAE